MNRNDQMIEAAKNILGILEVTRPDKHLDIRFWKIDDETIHCTPNGNANVSTS